MLPVEGIVIVVQDCLGTALQVLLEPGEIIIHIPGESGEILRSNELQCQLVILGPAAVSYTHLDVYKRQLPHRQE